MKKKLEYFISLEVDTNVYEEVIDKIQEIGEIISPPVNKITVKAKITVDADDISAMSDLSCDLDSYLNESIKIDDVTLIKSKE